MSRLLGNRARPVLRGDRCSNAAVLPDEIFFSLLGRGVLRHGDFSSRQDLLDKVIDFTVGHNVSTGPFRWNCDGRPRPTESDTAPAA
ncbi:hypothetical protein [Streptomyces sp. ISL-100]|uniref:hypothetical protein n=1 Tax=Streptomyces sp. ISL-100 TaxID=2819173 RepID=UPI001BE8EED5|nr:hypothetical protein [Streptomyces sp. ISL-100]MBT2401754.1 hypothetical protein [Streptomyces sp. ISL-100]